MQGFVQRVVVEFVEGSVFVEVLPRLMAGVADTVKMRWRPMVFEDASGDVSGKRSETVVCLPVTVGQSEW